MSLFICSINSGSNANCYYVGNHNEAVLIDAGLSCRETEKRMKLLGLTMDKVKAIFVSHEHTDHINGINSICKKYKLPVYITASTHKQSGLYIQQELIHHFEHNKPVATGSLTVTPFTKYHDATDPYSFLVSNESVNVGIITDIGHACKEVIKAFKKCDAVFLESNYCEDMLVNGSYPYHLKKRISSDLGHLSNKQALELFLRHKSKHLQLLILSHLSQNNNKPEIVESLFKPHAGNVKILVASRYAASEVFYVEANGKHTPTIRKKPVEQLKLF
ncbi:MAG: MBL fold metallo-hydrolase [Sphingobacteriales bacterium]|nr:MAG: MBL fold metallo-hydrolase [Sphingobacteriales bacterium]